MSSRAVHTVSLNQQTPIVTPLSLSKASATTITKGSTRDTHTIQHRFPVKIFWTLVTSCMIPFTDARGDLVICDLMEQMEMS